MPRARSVLAAFVAAMAASSNALSQTGSSPSYQVDRSPFVEIGGDGTNSEPLLESVFSATKTPHGFVIGESRSSTLLYFDAKGKFMRRVGRQGQGPGEFAGAIFVGPCTGDSLCAWDSRTLRVSVFTSSGSFVRQIPAFGARVATSGAGVIAMLLRPGAPSADRATSGGLMSSIKLFNVAGDSIASIANVPWGETRMFGASTSIALRRGELYVGTATAPLIDVYDQHGRPVRRITFPEVPRRTTAAAHARAVDGLLDAMKAAGALQNREQQRATMLAQPIPETFPPYREIAVSPNGVVWFLTTQIFESVAHLKGVRDDGTVVSDVDLALGDVVRLLEAGDDYLLLTYVNSEGIMKVGAFHVRARAKSP